MIRNIDLWLKSYLIRLGQLKKYRQPANTPLQILFTLCDHYEPYWNRVNDSQALKRVQRWVEHYPVIAANHVDCRGGHPQHCFFYPEEEYKPELLDLVAGICRNGFGEVEIHLHHDNDTAVHLRTTLLDFKKRLSEEHGLLSKDTKNQEIRYGFIHGNWALDNSRPDGRWCGVNNEIDVLLDTGCYADFTMPSAPDSTQTSTINSIYYAVDDPQSPKSHDTGVAACCGVSQTPGLLCVQGPLTFNFRSRKFGLLPRIENSCLAYDAPASQHRTKLWIDQRIHVQRRPDVLFVKLHTHGTQENNMDYFFNQGGLDELYGNLEEYIGRIAGNLYYVSTRQMYNVIKGLEASPNAHVHELLDNGLNLVS